MIFDTFWGFFEKNAKKCKKMLKIDQNAEKCKKVDF